MKKIGLLLLLCLCITGCTSHKERFTISSNEIDTVLSQLESIGITEDLSEYERENTYMYNGLMPPNYEAEACRIFFGDLEKKEDVAFDENSKGISIVILKDHIEHTRDEDGLPYTWNVMVTYGKGLSGTKPRREYYIAKEKNSVWTVSLNKIQEN